MRLFGSSAIARASFAVAVTAIAGAFAPSVAYAQQQPAVVQQFLANPGQTLQQYQNGGGAMVSLLREVAITDTGSLDKILGLIPNANKDQKTAIGKALGEAAQVVVKTNQAYANKILQAIAETKDQDVFMAYSGGANDSGTAATGGGGGGAGGGGGGGIGGQTTALGGTPTSTGPAQSIGGGSTQTANFSYTSSVSGTGSSTGTTTTFSTTSLATTVTP